MENIFTMVLAGGRGERLHPLTEHRAKPAVPFGGKYRIIDFTLSNCLNSGLRKVAVLIQYKSHSLDRHIRTGWDVYNAELGEFIASIPPQQRMPPSRRFRAAAAILLRATVRDRPRTRSARTLAAPIQAEPVPGERWFRFRAAMA